MHTLRGENTLERSSKYTLTSKERKLAAWQSVSDTRAIHDSTTQTDTREKRLIMNQVL